MLAAGAAAIAEQCKTIALFLHMLGSHVIKTFFFFAYLWICFFS